MPPCLRLPLLCLLLALASYALWWWPNRPQGVELAAPADRVQSVSFAPFRASHSPLAGRFPSAAEVEQDIRTIAPYVQAIRTYASIEGAYDAAEIAGRHGLAVFKGGWLGSDRAANEREMARLIESANRHPETVHRVIVGNEVLLRRDLPVEELIRQIERVKAAVRQPVTYADVWEFWEQFPEVARHVDIVTIHILPYWEDHPTGVAAAMAHVRDIYRRMAARFPGKPIMIGEVGWPARGRWRADAAPGRVEQTLFLRAFIALAREEGFDYNLIEAFDQVWKYRNEGTVGANWGLWTHARERRVTLSGPVEALAGWRWYAPSGIALALLLLGGALRAFPELSARGAAGVAALSFALGSALVFAAEGAIVPAYDIHLKICAAGNLLGQALLAVLLVRRVALARSGVAPPPALTGNELHGIIVALLSPWRRGWVQEARMRLAGWRDWAFDVLLFLFTFAAAFLALALAVDPRYRDFPLPTFAVPAIAVPVMLAAEGWPRLAAAGQGIAARLGALREEATMGLVLVGATAVMVWREGLANQQMLAWAAMALLLAAPVLARLRATR
ncbi:MAG: glycoside hydrolase [Alphaproteobacteria bacterium]|nr:glycoside hydrolase [Alphaproteobacteria bacterium]